MLTPMEARNEAVCARYLAGETAEMIAIDIGLSVMSVRVIIKAGAALRGDTPRVFRTESEKVLSPMHVRVGALLAHHRAFVRGLDRRSVSKELNWSVQRIASVEKGIYNLTLTDLQDLARFLEKPIEEILNGQSKTEHAPSNGPNLVVVPTPNKGLGTPSVSSVSSAESPLREWPKNYQHELRQEGA